MAWLNATPKPPEGSKRAKAQDLPPAVSRAEKMKADGIVPAMPSLSVPQLLTIVLEVGLTEATGAGSSQTSWQTIRAWQEVMGTRLPRWQARLIRKLSLEYLAEGRVAGSENSPPPWRAPVSEREKQLEVARLEMVLG